MSCLSDLPPYPPNWRPTIYRNIDADFYSSEPKYEAHGSLLNREQQSVSTKVQLELSKPFAFYYIS
jgi:hypothetical protein